MKISHRSETRYFFRKEIVHKQLISKRKQIKKRNVKNKTYLEIN